MSDEVYISESRALDILIQQGDYSENQARIILAHSLKQSYEGQTFYPARYVAKRAKGN